LADSKRGWKGATGTEWKFPETEVESGGGENSKERKRSSNGAGQSCSSLRERRKGDGKTKEPFSEEGTGGEWGRKERE